MHIFYEIGSTFIVYNISHVALLQHEWAVMCPDSVVDFGTV